MLHAGLRVLPAVHLPHVPARRPHHLRAAVHPRQPHGSGQHVLPDGSDEAAGEDVRSDARRGQRRDVAVPGAHLRGRVRAGQQHAGAALRHHTVPRHDLVLPLLHPLRQECREELFRVVYRLAFMLRW